MIREERTVDGVSYGSAGGYTAKTCRDLVWAALRTLAGVRSPLPRLVKWGTVLRVGAHFVAASLL